MRKIFILLFYFSATLFANGQVVINELSPANNSILADEDGNYPDWIELYNNTGSAYNLGGHGITDDMNEPAKWIFPAGTTIQPFGFLTLFASGKNRTEYFNHWETIVNAENMWRYITPIVEPDSNWRISPAFNDAGWNLGAGGIGYGDGDDSTILAGGITSVYMRRVFSIIDTADIASAVFHMDFDDAFVAYINGVEIARANIGVNGTPVSCSATALSEREAQMYTGGKPMQFYYDEALVKSVLIQGNNVLAIQVHNISAGSSDLSALPWFSLAIKTTSSNYGPVPSWFNLNASFLHTNFKLSSNGESVFLFDPGGIQINQLTYISILQDDSYGCFPDGTSTIRYFGDPTPNASNNSSTPYTAYTEEPDFSIAGGFYTGAQILSLSTLTAGGVIHYTINGNPPTLSSPVYSVPLTVDSTMVIKARTFHPTLLEGNTKTNTYFISDSSYLYLPVISLSVEPGLMFDSITGIYVKGPNAESYVPFFGANFWQEKEIPAHIEYYDKNRAKGFEQNIGIEIFGNYSRSYPQKSMKIIARDSYGDGTFNYQLFPDKDIHSFEQFILRNAGTDWNNAHMRDALVHMLAIKETNCDVMAYQPAVVYINGQYWGVYNMREKINKDYLADNHGVNPDSVDLLQYNGLVMEGTNERFTEMGIFVLLNDMTVPANFALADSLVDIENFADYFAMETWSNNWDWLTNNVRYWCSYKPDAKWRYILWDLDNGMGGSWSYVANSLDTNLNKPLDYTSLLFSKLLTNEGYKHYFINRYADLLNTTLTPDYFNNTLSRMRDTIDGEMPRHFNRWGSSFSNPNWGVDGYGSYDNWKNYQMHELVSYGALRQITARNHIQETFELKNQVPVALNVYPSCAGKIKINTITIEDMPWAGIYFDSIPVTVTVIPNPGYTFSFWQSDIHFPSPVTDLSLTFNPDSSDVYTAYFMGAPDTAKVIFSEINYRSPVTADAGDWVELHNPGQWPMDISGWKFKDGDNSNTMVFSENIVLQGGDYLVLCEDTAKFRLVYPGINNVAGPFGFGLSSAGESVRLFDSEMNLYLSVSFNSTTPWTTEANGTGKTLELLNAGSDLNDPSNWFAGCPGGSPGWPFVPCDNMLPELTGGNSDGVVSLYPNPVGEMLYIDFNPQLLQQGNFTLTLYNLSGSPVYSREVISEEMLQIENTFSPGMYFCVITSTSGYYRTEKIVFL
ncbi:MAG: CotH kinase family protein [Bacteroidota bacterium]